MAIAASAGKCEIVCAPVEVTNVKGKDTLIAESKNGKFTIQEGENEQEIKLSKGKLTEKFIGAKSYAKVIAKQEAYKETDRKTGKSGAER